MGEKIFDKRLMKFAKSSGKYIKLEEGDSFTGTYLTWRMELDEKFKKEKPVFVFKNDQGAEMTLGTGAKRFCKKMAQVVPGSLVQITRLGEGPKTDYTCKILKEAKMPLNVDEDDDEEEEDEEEVAPVAKKKKPVVEEEDEDEDEAPKKKKKAKVVEEDEDDEDDEDEEDDGLFA